MYTILLGYLLVSLALLIFCAEFNLFFIPVTKSSSDGKEIHAQQRLVNNPNLLKRDKSFNNTLSLFKLHYYFFSLNTLLVNGVFLTISLTNESFIVYFHSCSTRYLKGRVVPFLEGDILTKFIASIVS